MSVTTDPTPPPPAPPEEPEPENTHFVPSSQIVLGEGFGTSTATDQDYYLRAGSGNSWFLVADESSAGFASPRFLRVARIERTNKTLTKTSEVRVPVQYISDHFDNVLVHGASTTTNGWFVMVLECRMNGRDFTDPAYALYAFTFRPDGSFAQVTRMHQGYKYTVTESGGGTRAGYESNNGGNSLCGINNTELIFAMDMVVPVNPLRWAICAMRLTVDQATGAVSFTPFTRVWTGRSDNGIFNQRNFINPANNVRHDDNTALFWCWPFGSESVNRATLIAVNLNAAREIDIAQTDTVPTNIRTEPWTFMGVIEPGRYGIAGEIFRNATSTRPDGTPYEDGVAYGEVLYTPEFGFHGSVNEDGTPNYDIEFAIDPTYQSEEYAESISIYDSSFQPSDGMGDSFVFTCASGDVAGAAALHEFKWKGGYNLAGPYNDTDNMPMTWTRGWERFEPYDEEWGLAVFPDSTQAFGGTGNPKAVLVHRHVGDENPDILMPCDGFVNIRAYQSEDPNVTFDMYGPFSLSLISPSVQELVPFTNTDDSNRFEWFNGRFPLKRGDKIELEYTSYYTEGLGETDPGQRDILHTSKESKWATYPAQSGLGDTKPVTISFYEDLPFQGQTPNGFDNTRLPPNLLVELSFSCNGGMQAAPIGPRVHFDPRG